MKALPDGLDEHEVVAELAAGWGVVAATIEYAPLGFGSYHWAVVDPDGRRWFVTVDDLGRDGSSRARAHEIAILGAAFDTAIALREEADLEFVLAPVLSTRGETVRRLAPRYSIAIFPHIEGESQPFETIISGETAAAVVDILVRLHRSRGPERALAPTHDIALDGRAHIESAIDDLDGPWRSGPYAERVRGWVAHHATTLRAKLERFDDLVAHVSGESDELVITHGEPHPANFMHTDDGLMLIDWDTLALERPERDLWFLAGRSDGALDRYTTATGYRPDPDALALYRLRWELDDISIFLDDFRADHVEDDDTAESWRLLTGYPRPQ
jgi:spectinomycin phosphotransferase